MLIELHFFHLVFKVVKTIKTEVKSKCTNVRELYFLYRDEIFIVFPQIMYFNFPLDKETSKGL